MMRRLLFTSAWLVALGAGADVFSPGDLAKPHASLEGIRNCTQCHPSGGQLSQETCLDCHTELKGRVAKGNGFHGRIPDEQRACQECHKEHQGRDFKLVNWGKAGQAGFEHARTGWPLKGKHAEVKCDACHQPKRVVVPVIVQLLEKQPTRLTFLGLRTKCDACHFDEHRGQLQQDCDYCHREADWKKAAGFSHADTRYPLKGQHEKVLCEKCHPKTSDPRPGAFPAPVSETFLRLSPLEFRQCSDCHKDPHDGSFGARCSSCHVVESWKIIRNAAAERGFHEKTRYPLKGEHLDVACNACHGPFIGQPAKFKGLPFARCADCHVDGHVGQLNLGSGRVIDCADCHSVDGFVPPRFSLARHEKTKFPLVGSHRAVACVTCHVRAPALLEKVSPAVTLELKKKRHKALFSTATFSWSQPLEACDTCHRDPHDGQFLGRAGGCAKCHGAESFQVLSFNHDTDSSYPLEGKHREVRCVKCHAPATASEPLAYTPLQTTCDACHADPHARQFGAVRCESCHTLQSFTALRFLHQPPFTAFRLEGKHAAVPCEKCHAKVTAGPGKPVQRFKGAPATCEGCHSDFHRGAFEGFEP